MNKHSLIYSIVLIVVIFGSCKKVLDKLTQFNIEYNQTVTIPSSTGVNLPFNIITPDITTNSESTFASNNTRKDLIEKITVTGIDLTVKKPSNGSFSFLKSIAIYITAPGVAETKIAWKDAIPANQGKTLKLDVTQADLKEYIKQDKYTLRVSTVTDEVITNDYELNVHSTFFVDAKILGQ